MEPLHTSTVTARGGREGFVRSENGVIDMPLTMPKVLGGKGSKEGTNPEELFAAGYAACFESALRLVGRKRDLELGDVAVTADVVIGKDGGGGFALAARVRGHLPDVEDENLARELMEAAHQECPYSKATRGNMEVELSVDRERPPSASA
jgi:lipoyl-dependent peroxiredoxin